MAFFLLILTTLTFFLRPEELIPELRAYQIYYGVICVSLLVALPRIIDVLTRQLSNRPIVVLVLVLFASIPLSHLANGSVDKLTDSTELFGKLVAYFLLLNATIETKSQWYRFGLVVLSGGVFVAALAVLDFFAILDFPFIETLSQTDAVTSSDGSLESITSLRLQACGVFNDPNDLAFLSVVCLSLCAGMYYSTTKTWQRGAALAIAGGFVAVLLLTKSRGGLLGALCALSALLTARFGFKRCLPLLVIVAGALAFLGGRQADLSAGLSSGTGQARTELWFESIQCFKTSPLFGIGCGALPDEIGQVAHNSFLQAIAELGLLGGSAFVGCFYCILIQLWRVREVSGEGDDLRFRAWAAPLIALTCGMAGCQYSISRNYVIPTYLVLGIASTYLHLDWVEHKHEPPRLNLGNCLRIVGFAFALLASASLIIRVT